MLRQSDLTNKLKAIGSPQPEKEASVLLSYFGEQGALSCEEILSRRVRGEPLCHIIGWHLFRGLRLTVSRNVATPVFEIEPLVEAALALCEGKRKKPFRILDLGTGTGCLLLSLLHELPMATGVGVDLSDEAVSLATENAKFHGLDKRAVFVKGDWLEGLTGPFDLILSNPPAAPSADVKELPVELSQFEARGAVDGGEDGLDFFRRTAEGLDAVLADDGVCLFHVHTVDREAALFREAGFQAEVQFISVSDEAPGLCEPLCVVVRKKKGWLRSLLSWS